MPRRTLRLASASFTVLLALSSFALASPVPSSSPPPPPPARIPPPPPYLPLPPYPPPPPHPGEVTKPIDICGERWSLLIMRSYAFEITPCTIVLKPEGRIVVLSFAGSPSMFADAKGTLHVPVRAVFSGFVPILRVRDGGVYIRGTPRTLSVRLPKRPLSVIKPYVVKLPRAICREDGWLVSIVLSDGTETLPFGPINSMCGPNSKRRSAIPPGRNPL